jgi:DNA-binding response OmpR family regulator
MRSVVVSKQILVVEDDERLRRLIHFALAFEGFDVRVAGDGVTALQRIDLRAPDLIVLDLCLPGLSGVAVRHEVAAQALTRHIPIVVITGGDASVDDLDVSCVLRKPFSTKTLVATVQRYLESAAPSRP